ncbi:MAG: tetratricopeptide repeat protein [Verrucomicrobia bacterium]|nr:tetratricopeptide repeat protein [Verrucomicrobiota bacterium]
MAPRIGGRRLCRAWGAVLAGCVPLLAWADAPVDPLMAAGVAEFTAAYQAWDGRQFGAAADLFRRAATHAPESSAAFYWLGVAEFHRMLQLQTLPASRANETGAAAAREAALAALSSAVRLDARHAEAHALLGTLYGMKIDGNLLRAARFGSRVHMHRRRALELGAANPRVQYLLGTCQFHTARKPAARREALATFLEAERLFAAEAGRAAGALEPRWGRSTCLTFIGRTCESLGRREEAAGYFRKALAEHPADHVAREGLARVGGDRTP